MQNGDPEKPIIAAEQTYFAVLAHLMQYLLLVQEGLMAKPTRILVVNDTQEILELFRDLLVDAGYEVTLLSYAPTEMTEVQRINPDLIILDLIFGSERLGMQLLDKLKMKRETAAIPVIICSAAITALRDIEGYLKAHGVAIVPKPFDIDVLLETIKQALNPAD